MFFLNYINRNIMQTDSEKTKVEMSQSTDNDNHTDNHNDNHTDTDTDNIVIVDVPEFVPSGESLHNKSKINSDALKLAQIFMNIFGNIARNCRNRSDLEQLYIATFDRREKNP